MKKVLIVSFLFCSLSLSAQNIQFLTNGKVNFATFEIFKPYDHGALYYFSDFKMTKNGFDEVYSEISAYINVYKTFSITAQYNAGLNKDSLIFPVYLCGLSKSFKIGQKIDLSIDVLYRHQNFLYLNNDEDLNGNLYLKNDEKQDGYQITTIFSGNFNKIQISGYCDFWNTKYVIFEPQGWYNLYKNLWIGLEWRASNYTDVLNYNINNEFIGNYSNYIMGGIKWNLN